MKHITKRFSEGQPALTVLALKQLTGVPVRLISDALMRLERVKLVTVVATSKDEDERYQPALSLDHLRMGHIVELLDNASADRHKNNYLDLNALFDDKAKEEVRQARMNFIQKLNEINDL